MRDEYFVPMNELIVHTRTETGYTLPEDIEVYVSALLAHYIDKPNFLPEQSFAEAYTVLGKRDYESAKNLGDTCLFLSGVFPKYGKRYGLNKRYYREIGSSSYGLLQRQLFQLLARNFDFVAEYIHLTTQVRQDIRIINES